MSNGQWKLVPVEPTREMLDAARFYREGEHTLAAAYRAMLDAAPDAPSAEPAAWRLIDGDDCEYNTVDRFSCGRSGGEPLYAIPPDAAAEIARLRSEVERLTVERRAVGGCFDDEFSERRRLQIENQQQAERIAELEASLEIEKGQCELREEENRILFARMEAQSAALTKAQHTLRMVGQCLAWQVFGECRSYGEGVPLLKSHEADALCKEALSAIAQLDGAQAGEEVKPQNDAERVAE